MDKPVINVKDDGIVLMAIEVGDGRDGYHGRVIPAAYFPNESKYNKKKDSIINDNPKYKNWWACNLGFPAVVTKKQIESATGEVVVSRPNPDDPVQVESAAVAKELLREEESEMIKQIEAWQANVQEMEEKMRQHSLDNTSNLKLLLELKEATVKELREELADNERDIASIKEQLAELETK